MVRSRGVVGLVVVSACFATPTRPAGSDANSSIDGAADSGPPRVAPACAMTNFGDTFLGSACGVWGTPFMNNGATITSGTGVLVIDPSTQNQSGAGCVSTNHIPFTEAGFFFEVENTLTVPNGYFAFQLTGSGGSGGASIVVSVNRFQFGTYNVMTEYHSTPYAATAMRWWRLRPAADRASVFADISSNGDEWFVFWEQPLAVADDVILEISAGTNAANTNDPAPARIRRLGICP